MDELLDIFNSYQALCWVLNKVVDRTDVTVALSGDWDEESYRKVTRDSQGIPAWLKQYSIKPVFGSVQLN